MNEIRSNVWLVESLRFSAFLAENVTHQSEWWKTLTGEEPSNRIQRPAQGEFIEDGPFMGGLLQIRVQYSRVDFFLLPIMFGDLNTSPNFPNLGEFKEVVNKFELIINKWVEVSGLDVVRVAFGFNGNQKTANKEETYKVLQKVLPFVNIDVKKWQDFFLQVNLPRSETLDFGEVYFNRLIKVHGVQENIMQFEGNEHSPRVDVLHAVKLELDINTIHENTTIWPIDKTKKILPFLYKCDDLLGG